MLPHEVFGSSEKSDQPFLFGHTDPEAFWHHKISDIVDKHFHRLIGSCSWSHSLDRAINIYLGQLLAPKAPFVQGHPTQGHCKVVHSD
jgi:hypothetical protein